MIDPTSTQALITAGFPLVGGGLLGAGVGYLLKKLLKLAIIAIGAIALLLGYLEFSKWISVNWLTVENQTQSIMSHAANKIVVITQNMSHEIPIGLGVIGFLPGVAIGLAKG
jgi:uncharacterized membrane protein (Fun14 family)